MSIYATSEMDSEIKPGLITHKGPAMRFTRMRCLATKLMCTCRLSIPEELGGLDQTFARLHTHTNTHTHTHTHRHTHIEMRALIQSYRFYIYKL